MEINKYKKISGNKYKVYIDNKPLVLYEDVILKYMLLYKKNIDEKTLSDIEKDNLKSSIFEVAIKYISYRMRSKKEITEHLNSKYFKEKDINETINKLEDRNLINDELFCKSYINDRINLSNHGVNKIINELLQLGIEENIIKNNIGVIDKGLIKDRIQMIVEKEIKLNNKIPAYKLKNKIVNKCITLGYEYDDIYEILEDINIKTDSNIKKDYDILYKKYSNKYKDLKLKLFIKNKLYQKGYGIEEINNIFE